jgi:hypothetical protein
MKVSDLPVAEDVKDVTVVADAWGQGVVVTLLSREINDNGVENQAKLINYVHQTLWTFKDVSNNTGTFLYH